MHSKLSEEETKTRFITPALQKASHNTTDIGMEQKCDIKYNYTFSDGRLEFKKHEILRGQKKKVDYLLYYPASKLQLAIIEAKAYDKPASEGLAQAINYAEILDIPFAYASNGKEFVEYDFFTGKTKSFKPSEFPTPEVLFERYWQGRGLKEEQAKLLKTPYYLEEKEPRYYQINAINKTFEAIMQGQKRILLVMATGTGKTYTASQIAHRLYEAKIVKKILYLADRNVLIDQSVQNDFKHFKKITTKIQNRHFDSAYEFYFGIYQQFIEYKENEQERLQINHYKELKPDFFDLIFIDECHRGSARADSTWREILEYFTSAIQIGLTATPKLQEAPKHTEQPQNSKEPNKDKQDKQSYISCTFDYFGKPLYTYSLKQGIEDGFLAPYKVVRYMSNLDIFNYRPTKDKLDKEGNIIPDKEYFTIDFDRKIVIDERTQLVAHKITQFLQSRLKDPYAKTIVFCDDEEHALAMRDALIAENPTMMKENHKYIMRITSSDKEGKEQLDNFISIKESYPVIVTTSQLLSTGVDTKMVKLIVLDKSISSLTEFKQIIGRGTRLVENKGKSYFVILDFKGATRLFADPEFDGDFESFELLENGELKAEESAINEEIITALPSQEDKPTTAQEKNKKIYVNGVECSIEIEQEQILDAQGNLISNDFKAYSKTNLQKCFGSLKAFLEKWNQGILKNEILKELENSGILIEELRARDEFKNLDEFDILLKLGFDQSTLSRKERAKKANEVLSKYEGKARKILELLLAKYAEFGISEIENPKIYETEPFKTEFGGSIQDIITIFGGIDKYQHAIAQLKTELYRAS